MVCLRRGAQRDIATVSHRDMDQLLKQMLTGATVSPQQPPRYDGLYYDRPDGSRFGVRYSHSHGLTLDLQSFKEFTSKIPTKVHAR